jgi:hypothetical protein
VVPAVDWNAVAAIGQCLGALATFLAVVVALYTARAAAAVRLKVSTSLKQARHHNVFGPFVRETAVFRVSNLSHRSVHITDVGLVLPNGRQVPLPVAQPGLPRCLKEMEVWEIGVPAPDMRQLFKENHSPAGTLRVFFADGRGRRHWCKWKGADPDNWQWQQAG